MTDLERRALLGDREAQEECTRQGIVLPCPFGTDHKIQVYKYDPCDGYQGDLSRWRIRCECGICLEDENLEKLKGKWNTRTAPPFGRFPFSNDPFSMVAMAFERLYPKKKYIAYWNPNIRDSEDGKECFGLTDFDMEEKELPVVFVKPTLNINTAVEIFAHELAHVAVGPEEDHGTKWEEAFDAIFLEYNRIGTELFGTDESEYTQPKPGYYEEADHGQE